MTTAAAVAHAIHKDLDILKALPEVADVDISQLESFVEDYVKRIQQQLCEAVEGCETIESMCKAVTQKGIELPTDMIQAMCKTIMMMKGLDAKFMGQKDDRPCYLIRISI